VTFFPRLRIAAARWALVLAATPPITIGVFLPTKGPSAQAGREMLAGAQIAVDAANRSGGVAGRSLRLTTAPSDLSWEAASGSLTRLIYEEKAVAIVGAADGRSAHLAQQVITRARGQAVLVTVWASEPTLTQIRIPWFFRVVPDDRLQAAMLAGEIFSTRRIEHVAIWVEDSFDARAAGDAFVDASPPGAVTRFAASEPGASAALLSRAGGAEFGAVVLYAGAEAAAAVAGRLRQAGCRALLAGPLRLAVPEFTTREAAEGTLLLAPVGFDGQPVRSFEETLRPTLGGPASPLASYSHDAVEAIVEALRRTALSGGDLGAALETTSIQGLTGAVRFDDHRNRTDAPTLAVIRAGRAARLDRTAAAASRSEGRR
jgi:branched-chain amino acid transport system substrate-binding protein